MERNELPATDFMDGITTFVRELVQNHSTVPAGTVPIFSGENPSRESLGSCPRCQSPVYESKANFYCSNRACQFSMWKTDRFFESKKKLFTAEIAAALLRDGCAKGTKLFSEKKGLYYDAVILLADTGGKYVNYRLDFENNGRNKA